MKKLYIILLGVALGATSVMAQEDEVTTSKIVPVHYINLSPKIGYAVGFDNINKIVEGNYMQSNPFGGGGAGLGLEYELEYGHFLFNTGVDFDWTHAITNYNIAFNRNMVTPYDWTYHYRMLGYSENRDVLNVGLPVRFGAQFGNFYFLVGAKVGYNLPLATWNGFASGKHYYQVTATDPVQPGVEIGNNSAAGLGVYHIDRGTDGFGGKLDLKPLDVRATFEAGIDLDPWLQAPKPKKMPKQKKGAKYYPFTKHNLHYRLGFFAEYGVLNINNAKGFSASSIEVTDPKSAAITGVTNTVLGTTSAKGAATLNNLFVGAKFTIGFEMPGKKPKKTHVQIPPSVLWVKVYDQATNKQFSEPVDVALTVLKTGKTSQYTARNGQYTRKFNKGDYKLGFSHPLYYSDTLAFSAVQPGSMDTIAVFLRPRPRLNIRVVDGETGAPLKANVQITNTILTEPISALTDSITGKMDTLLMDGNGYEVAVTMKGYEPYKTTLTSIGDNLEVRMTPIKVGRTFVLENMHFATAKTKILERSEPALQTLYEYMTDEMNKDRRIRIIGHTDNVGKDAANQKLSEGRAKAVREELIKRGIDPSRIEAEGRGETQPRDTNDTEEGRQNNRRVEIEVLE